MKQQVDLISEDSANRALLDQSGSSEKPAAADPSESGKGRRSIFWLQGIAFLLGLTLLVYVINWAEPF